MTHPLRPLPWGAAAAALALATVPQVAEAATCDTLVLDDGAQDVMIGEYTIRIDPVGAPPFAPPTGDLGVCWRDDAGSWHMERLACDTDHTAADMFKLRTRGGDDRVAVLMQEHTVPYDGFPGFVRAGAYADDIPYQAVECDGEEYLAPWKDTFEFGVWADLGTGADEFYGSPNDDRAASNVANITWTFNWPAGWTVQEYAPADNAVDLLCGAGGDDELYGDRDDSYTAGAEELLDGGPGYDVCDGDPFVFSGSSISDVARSTCESREDAWWSDAYFSCEDGADPLDWL